VQSRQLGFNDVEASTPSTGAHADSLAYESECRSLRRSKRKQRSRECKRKQNLTHTYLLTDYTNLTYIWFLWRCLVGHEAGQSIRTYLNHQDVAKALGVSVQTVTRLKEDSDGFRAPPRNWKRAVIRLAEARVLHYRKLIEKLKKPD
jgi:hypothetical protein